MSIELKSLSYIYSPGTPFEKKALDNVSLTVSDGEYVGLIGHTGSGKSTLVQHLNGLLRPASGSIIVQGIDLTEKKPRYDEVRRKVGLVFQYPEYQLFEETVAKDIAFGPKNLGLSEEEIAQRVSEAMELVGLSAEIGEKNPFELSGGQKRRAAIAGVLSMRPEVLVLDEPIAGLDPRGRDEILALIDNYHTKTGATIVLVSHNMDDIAHVAQRVIVMHEGKPVLDGTPQQVFSNAERLQSLALDVPQAALLVQELARRGMYLPKDCITIEQVFEAVMRQRKGELS